MLTRQRLVSGYGFRPSSDHSVLVRIATECWEAKHPPATRTKKGKGKAKPSTTGTDKGKRSKKQGIEPTAGAPTPSATLDEQFYRMMHDDEAFWIRILRYEPIAFDELVSRALQAGIQGKKWKEELRRFLDMRVSLEVWIWNERSLRNVADAAGCDLLHCRPNRTKTSTLEGFMNITYPLLLSVLRIYDVCMSLPLRSITRNTRLTASRPFDGVILVIH